MSVILPIRTIIDRFVLPLFFRSGSSVLTKLQWYSPYAWLRLHGACANDDCLYIHRSRLSPAMAGAPHLKPRTLAPRIKGSNRPHTTSSDTHVSLRPYVSRK